jgi:peptidyl-prolyl cis-trans isomerase SurA
MLRLPSSVIRISVVCIALFAAAASTSRPAVAAADETLVDRVVAVVDGEPILYSDVMDKVKKGPLVLVSPYPGTEEDPPYDQAFNDAINFQLILDKARDLEIDVEDSEVEAEIKSFLASKNTDMTGLLEFLKQQGSNYEDYKADFKNQMILRQFQGRVIFPQVKITDKDVETYYLKKSGATSDLVELALRQIVIKVDPAAAPDVVTAKHNLAPEVYKKLKDGMSFEDAVKIYSDDEAARASGGLTAGIKLKDLAGQIRTEVENLDVGQFTAPVRTGVGFHLFYLEEKRFSGSTEFQTQKKQLEFELRNAEAVNQTRRWLTEQRQKSKIEIVKD